MENFEVTTLLLAALALPVGLFLLLRSRLRLDGRVAALVAVGAGWALNVAWAFMVARDPSQADGDTLSIAAYFGWACPAVLVALTWLVLRFASRRAA